MAETKKQISNDEYFDKQVEKAKEEASSLTPSLRTLTFNTELASSLDESKLFEVFREMDNDAIISSALDLYADNVAQENPKTGHVVSIVSADKAFEEEINSFLHNVVNMDTESWNIVRSLAQYGKVVLDTKASNNGADWAFIEVERPEDVLPLTYGQDNVRYFAVKNKEDDKEKNKLGTFYGTTTNQANTTYNIEPSDRYIVGFTSRKHVGKMIVETESALLNGDNETTQEELYIRAGKSLLEGVIESWRTLSTLEDSLFINRLLKSTAFNIVSVDVSDTNNKQAQQMIDEVKKTLRSSETIDVLSQRYSSRQSPIPVNDFIYVPVKGEKGAISITQVGGEVGEIDLKDVDYHRNKVFAGLGVLKAYLGFEETTPGGLGDTTLTMLDERFSRTVKRLRTVLGHITRQMVNYYWVYSNLQRTIDNIPDYYIELGKISTREEEANRKSFSDGISAAQSFLGIADKFTEFIDREKLFKYIFTELINIDISKIDNTPEEHEIDVTLKQLKEIKFPNRPAVVIANKKPIYKTRKRVERKQLNYLQSTYQLLMELPEVQTLLEEYDLYAKINGKEESIYNLLERPNIRRILDEATYTDLRNKTKLKDPKRVAKSKKITGQYIGYDPDEDVIIFEMSAEDPEQNKKEGRPTSYETQVRLLDLITFIKNRKKGDTDLSLVRAAMQGDIKVGCECPASKYWGQQYNGTKEGYSLVHNEIEPTRNKQYQVLCKHTTSMLLLLPFWANTIVGDIRQAGTFKKYKVEEDEPKVDDIELTPEEEKEELDKLAGETDSKDEKDLEDKDKDLKDKVASKADKTKKKVKK